jgi:EAL domain-containing protein (putative c-di-GMP-specific phosphodiesterase class I)
VDEVADSLCLEDEWQEALEAVSDEPERLVPVFQPIVDLRRGTVCGYEALSRFDVDIDADPVQWFTAAAALGWSTRLETIAMRAFLGARRELPANCFLSINLSPEAAASDEMAELLEDEDLSGLVLEITEQTPVDDYDRLTAALDRWRAGGIQIAVDDAGSGYASLRHILAVRPQFVKLDRSLVAGVSEDPHKLAAVTAIGALAGELDAWVVAEGISEAPDLDALVAARVPLAQGFLLGRPAAGMDALDGDVAHRIRTRATRSARGGVERLLEESVPGALVLTDDWGRPTEMVVGGRRHPAYRCGTDDRLGELALRAMARPAPDRLSPFACTNTRGRFIGFVRVERIVAALARD